MSNPVKTTRAKNTTVSILEQYASLAATPAPRPAGRAKSSAGKRAIHLANSQYVRASLICAGYIKPVEVAK